MSDLPEHAVIVHLTIGGTGFGDADTREDVRSLKRAIETKLAGGELGDLDGDEFGGGEAVLYLYGPDADNLYAAIEPALRQSTLRPAHTILRYGPATDPAARNRRIEIH